MTIQQHRLKNKKSKPTVMGFVSFPTGVVFPVCFIQI